MIGKTISDYAILRMLGEGGTGKVYLAKDNQQNREVALKFLMPHLEKDPNVKKRFEQEAQITASLNHSSIVVIHRLDECDGYVFIVMEYVPGETLYQKILAIRNKSELLPTVYVIRLANQICETLKYIHSVGLIHGNIKAQSIIVRMDGSLKMLGLKGESQQKKEFLKTDVVSYLSPEQIQENPINHLTDIWSFGILLFELLTGNSPFPGDDPKSIITSIMNEPLPKIAAFKNKLPEELEWILLNCLVKDPAKRLPSIEPVIEKLKKSQLELKSLPEEKSTYESIDDLLDHRSKIDRIIEERFTRYITIMFSDVVGSTSFFERRGDLEGRAMLKRYNRIIFPIIRSHDGEVIKTLGDGILASFPKPEWACKAAINMQNTLKDHNSSKPTKDQITIRIALHHGNAVIDKGDVYGDVVNAASRLESRAQPKEILISYDVYEKVKSDSELSFVFVGKESLKGKEVQVGLYRLLWDKEDIKNHRYTIHSAGDLEQPDLSTSVKTSAEDIKIIKPFKLTVSEKKAGPPVSKNPYMNRLTIKNIDEFYGRKNEVSKIYSRIGASRPQSISIVGERRIGKSSLLNYIYHPQNRLKHLKNPDENIFVLIDFQEKRQIKPTGLFETIFACLREEFNNGLKIGVAPDYNGFKKVVSTLDSMGLKLILIFDEFEVITKSSEFNSEFYSYARSMANNYNLSYIVSSGRNLQTMCHSREISDSPFFNIFSNLTLTQFTEAEAIELILVPAEKSGYSMKPWLSTILDLSGYYPFYIQMVCAGFFEYLRKDIPLGKKEIEKIKEEIFDEARVHFQQIWDMADEDQRAVLLTLCGDSQIPGKQEFVLKNLIKSGFVKIENNKPKVFSSLFQDFLIEKYGTTGEKAKNRKFSFWRS
jgi:serine/threonine protein kinase